jgi:S-DNA-T family DNA segregation ATPase FtsK/SpoIIIE
VRVTAISGSGVAADVELDEGVPVAALRGRLARLTGDAAWLAGTTTADGEPLHDAHRAGLAPLVHGAVLRPGPGPVPEAVAAARAPRHVAVVAGLDAGTLLVPRGPCSVGCSLGTGGDLAVHDEGGWCATRPTPRVPPDLVVRDEDGWLIHVRPARQGRPGLLVRRGTTSGARPVLARRGRWSGRGSGAWSGGRAGHRLGRPWDRLLGRWPNRLPGRHRVRPVPARRWVRWREGEELWAGASVLVLRAGAVSRGPLGFGAATQGVAAPGAFDRRYPGGSWLARAARFLPALAGAATSVALAVGLHQPVLLLGALSALVLLLGGGLGASGSGATGRGGLGSGASEPAAFEPGPRHVAGWTGAMPDDDPADFAALRIALALGHIPTGAPLAAWRAPAEVPLAAWHAPAEVAPAPGRAAPRIRAAPRGGLVGPPPGLPWLTASAPHALSVPWFGDLAITGPRGVALACARGLLLAALGPYGELALRTDRPEDWAWLTWRRRAPTDAPGSGGPPALVVLDGVAAAADWHPAHRVLRLLDGPAPAWCRSVLTVDRHGARLREAGWPERAVPLVGVRAEVAEAILRGWGRGTCGVCGAPSNGGRAPGRFAAGGFPPNGSASGEAGSSGALDLDGCPAAVTLGALPDVPPPDGRAIARAWRRAETARLRIALGVGPDGAPVVVDLVADGPHALVAGTTGSGKSELLTTLVLGLALTHPPDRLAVLLVDFKGGTGLPALAGLPHVVGRLSDLDAAGARRTLRGLFAELRRRERVLADRGASDVRELAADTPPRLVVVIDEFRVLADELPELLPGLARIAAQGRSLGVHLVLATQRPAGAIPADLRANVALRAVLRVADAADSLDLVGVPDAARIDRPGLAVLARGAGRPEPVQVARAVPRAARPVRLAEPWPPTAGAVPALWVPGPGPERPDRAVGPVGSAGTSPPADEGVRAWCSAIAAAASGRPRAAEPWLPPLPDRVHARDVPPGPGLPLALADLPDDLARGPVRWDPDAGHLLVVGGPGSGRSTTLASVAAAAVASGRAVHAVGLPVRLRPAGLASVLDTDDMTRVARLVRLLSHAHGPGPRPLLVLDDVATVLDALAGLARGSPADLLAGLWSTAGGPVAVVAGGAIGPTTTRLAAGFADRLVLGSPDPSADLLAGVPAGLAGARPLPGRAVHVGPRSAALCQVALPDERVSPDSAELLGSSAPPGDPRVPGAPAWLGRSELHDDPASHGLRSRGGPGSHDEPARVVSPGSPDDPARLRGPSTVPPCPGGAPPDGAPVPRGLVVRPLPSRATAPEGDPSPAAGVPLGVGGDDAGVIRVDIDRPLLVVGPPGSGRTTALETLAAGAARAGRRVVRIPGAAPDDEDALLVVDDLDELEARHPDVAEALAERVELGRPGRLLAATTTAHAASAFRGPAAALVRARRLLVLDLVEPGSLDLLGPDGAWLVDARRRPPGRGALRIGREVTPAQVFALR